MDSQFRKCQKKSYYKINLPRKHCNAALVTLKVNRTICKRNSAQLQKDMCGLRTSGLEAPLTAKAMLPINLLIFSSSSYDRNLQELHLNMDTMLVNWVDNQTLLALQ